MRKKIIQALCLSFLFCVGSDKAVSQTQPGYLLLSKTIADRMKDSLGLSSFQADSIYQINVRIVLWKQHVWQQKDSLIGKKLQLIENKRDSLYHTIIDYDQFELYQKKKAFFLNAR